MLQKRPDVLSSHSTYPEGIVLIKFDPEQVNESALKGFIAEMGFHAEKV